MLRSPETEPEQLELEAVRPGGVWSLRIVWVLCVTILVFAWVDALYLGRFVPWMLGVRVLWASSMLGYTYLVRVVPRPWVGLLTVLNALISTVCVLALSMEMDGLGGPYFIMVPVLPLAITLIYRRHVRAVLVSGAVGVAGTALLLWRGNHSFYQWLTWLSVVVGIAMLAAYFSHQTFQAQQVEQQGRLKRARREALEALAFSEHRRAQSEKLAIVGRLASGVAHEINNPLAYVGSNVNFVHTELVEARELDREELAEVLAETRVGIQHIRQIVADLRGFARMDANEPTACALVDVVADAMKLASLRLKHVSFLQVDVPTDLPEIFVVRQRLVQVVLNLLINAGDVLESHPVPSSEVRLVGRAEQECVVLLVEDNGPGFAPHVLPRLFEAFFTTKSPDKGTGLGLTLSRELVEQFGGALSASNRPEGGARLRIELPVSRAGRSEAPATEPEGEARGAA
ncbi:sensor histidine kinase [Archangium lansingense]|uniref:histidine kinase n=1 Tax=Archangium lansingense TaxID=2995310 RepID=A0ABT4AE31_9BACT|nr:ATP-binding protein [Archangium lansinium]MCY1079919.1 ATP-binding protein [Archangium lansinium]